MYSIVKFPNERTTDIVRSDWIRGEETVWPPYRPWSEKFENALVNDDPDSPNWKVHPIKLVCEFGTLKFTIKPLLALHCNVIGITII